MLARTCVKFEQKHTKPNLWSIALRHLLLDWMQGSPRWADAFHGDHVHALHGAKRCKTRINSTMSVFCVFIIPIDSRESRTKDIDTEPWEQRERCLWTTNLQHIITTRISPIIRTSQSSFRDRRTAEWLYTPHSHLRHSLTWSQWVPDPLSGTRGECDQVQCF